MSKRKFQFLVTLIFSILVSVSAHAEMGIPVQLRLKSPGGTYPTESGVAIKLQVLTPAGGCILREEIFSGRTITEGNISLVLGSGAAGTYDPGLSLNAVYDNSKSKTGLTCVNASNVVVGTGQTYVPTSIDQRLIRFTATVTGLPIVVDFNMKSIPYAIQAESVGGKVAADIIVNNATSQLNQTNLNNLLLDATRLTNLLDVAQNGNAQSAGSAVNFTGSLTGDVTGTQAATVVARLRGVNISATTPTSGQILVFDGTQYAPASQAAAAVTSVAGRTGAVILTSADIGGLGTAATRNTGVASGNVVQLDSAGKVPTSTLPNNLLTTSSTLAGDVSGNISTTVVNNVGGKTSAQVSQSVDDTIAATSSSTAGTIVKRDGSGNTSLNTITSLNNSTQNVYFYNVSNTNNVRVRAPVTFSDYMLTLPTTDGDLNQVLRTDGAGLLTWVDFPTTGVQSVSATAPLVATGSTNVSLSINVGTSAGTVAAGNDSRIANALQTSAVFGGDVSGTYNNLVLNNSGVTASTYAKVTVDAKGRVTSGGNLVASDIPNLDTNKITSGTFAVARGGTGLSAAGTANQVLGVNAAATGLEYKTITAGSNIMVSNTAGVLTISSSNPGGTVTNVSSGDTFLNVVNSATTPVITANVGVASGTLAAGNDTRITNALQFSTVFSGDVSGTYNSIVLNNSGVAASTYSKVTVDAKGRVTSGSAINSSDVVTALGYTPADAASSGATVISGDVTGTISSSVVSLVGGKTSAQVSQSVSDTIAATSLNTINTIVKRNGSGAFNASSGVFESNVQVKDGAAGGAVMLQTPVGFTSYALTFPTTDGDLNQVLRTDGAGLLTWVDFPTTGVQGVSATAPLVATGSTNVSLSINVGTSAGTVAAGNDSRIANALQTSAVFGGDVSGTYNNLVLNNSGVTASTYAKVTVDAKGRVTSGTSLTASDIPNLDTNKITSGTFAVARGGTGLSAAGTANQVLGVNAAATGLEYKTITAGSNIMVSNTAGVLTISSSNPGGTVTNVTATAPLSVSNGTTTPSLSISQANTSTAGFLAAADWNLFNSKLSTLDLGSVSATGTLAIARLPMFGGDVSSVSGSNVLTLNNSGVAASTYAKVTVDAKGRVTSGSAINSSDVVTALGYTPANAASAGTVLNVSSANAYVNIASATTTPVITLNVGTVSNTVAAGNDSRILGALQQTTFNGYVASASCTSGQSMYWNSVGGNFQCQNILLSGDVSGIASATTVSRILGTSVSVTALANNNILQYNGSAYVNRNIPTCAANEFLTFSGTTWTCAAVSGLGGGTVTNVTSSNSYLSVATGTTTPMLTINVGVVANTVAAGDDSRIVNALQPTTNFSGDVSGTYNTLVLSNSGVAAATYAKVTVDAKGRVTSGTSLTALDIPNLDTNKITSGTFAVARGGTGLSAVGTANQVLGVNAAATGLEYKTITAGSNITVSNTAGVLTISSSNPGGTVTNVTATAPLSVSNGTTTPSLSISQANTTTAGFLAAADWNLFNSKLSTLDLGSVSATGTLAIARLPMFAGDVSSVSGSNVLAVGSVGGKTSAQVSQSVSDTIAATSLNTINTIVKRNGSGAFNASSGVFESNVQVKDGSAGGAVTLQTPVGFTSYALTFPTTDGDPSQVLQTNGSGVLSWMTAAVGSVTNVTSANSYVSVTNGASTPVITANVGTAANTLAAGDDSRIVNALQTSTVFGGDVSGTYNNLVLNNSGVAAATYSKVTVDAKGRVTSGTSLIASDIPNLDTNKITSGTFAVARGGTGLSAVGSANQVLGVNAAATGLEYKTITAGTNITVSNTAGVLTINSSNPGGTVTNVSSANSYVTVTNGASTPVITANIGAVSGTLAAGDDTRIVNALQPTTVFAGDVSGTASTTSVNRIRGINVLITTLASNNILQYNGTDYVNRAIPTCSAGQYLFFNGTVWSCVADGGGTVTNVTSGNSFTTITAGTSVPVITVNVGTVSNTVAAGNDSRIVGALQQTTFNGYVAPASCTASQTMYWNSVSSAFNCQSILVSGDVTGNASTTVVTKIRGFSVSATAPVAGQALVYDGTSWVPTTGFPRYMKLTATQAFSLITSTDVVGLSFPVTAGKRYRFKFTLVYTSAATATGARFGLTFPTAADMSALVNVSNTGTDGTGAMYTGLLNSSGDAVTSTGSSAGRNYGEVTGVISPTVTGALQLQAGSEVAASAITLQAGSNGELIELP